MDILESLSFLHTLLQFGSLSQWSLNRKSWSFGKSRLLEIYTAAIILASTLIWLSGLFINDDFQKTTANEIGQTVDFIQMVGIRVAHIVSITESIVRRAEQQQFYEKVREIDRIFECSLNTNVDNCSLRHKVIKRGTIMLLIYLLSELFIVAIHVISPEQYSKIFWVLYLLPFFVCGLRYFQVFASILIIKTRFDKLIDILGEIDLLNANDKSTPTLEFNGVHSNAATLKTISKTLPNFNSAPYINRRYDMEENPELKRLLIVRDLYNRLWELTNIVNRCFGVSTLINVGNDFISITSNCYWIFLNFKEYSSTLADFLQIAGSAVWSIPHLFNVLVLALVCERTVQCATGIALGLHRLEFNIWNDNHNTVIEQFSLQLLHQKMAFTAAGFFDINCTLLYTIAGSTTTYLIILIQFHMNEVKTTT